MPPLDPIVSEFASTEEEEEYDRWFRAKVEKALASTKPLVSNDVVKAEIRDLIESKLRARGSVDG